MGLEGALSAHLQEALNAALAVGLVTKSTPWKWVSKKWHFFIGARLRNARFQAVTLELTGWHSHDAVQKLQVTTYGPA